MSGAGRVASGIGYILLRRRARRVRKAPFSIMIASLLFGFLLATVQTYESFQPKTARYACLPIAAADVARLFLAWQANVLYKPEPLLYRHLG